MKAANQRFLIRAGFKPICLFSKYESAPNEGPAQVPTEFVESFPYILKELKPTET